MWVFLLILTYICLFDEFQVASNPKPPQSNASIELQHAMCKNVRQSTSSYSYSSYYNSGGRRTLKCVMVGLGLDPGYSCGAKIFKNVEAMRAKEFVAKEKDAVSKARHAIVGVGLWALGKMILGRTIQWVCGITMLFNLHAIHCIFYLQ